MNPTFTKQNIQTGAFGIFFTGLFWGLPVSSIAILVFLLYFVVMLFVNGIQKPKRQHWILGLPVLYFLITLLSTLLGGSPKGVGFEIEVKLSFLLAPLLFALQKDRDRISLNKLIFSFLTASALSITALIAYHMIRTGSLTQIPKYSEFSRFIHPSYLAMYLSLAIFFCVEYWNQFKKARALMTVSVGIFSIGIYLTDSKAGILILLVLIGFLVLKKAHKYHKALSLGSLGALVLAVVLLFSFHPRFKVMKDVMKEWRVYIEQPERYVESTAERIQIWYASGQLLKEKPILGYGNGRSNKALYDTYKELGFTKSAERKLNAHNQYFESWLGLGIAGIVLLLMILFMPLWILSKEKRNLYLGFLLLLSLNFLFESMLQKQAGIVFFTFFWCAFVALEQKKRLPETRQPLKE